MLGRAARKALPGGRWRCLRSSLALTALLALAEPSHAFEAFDGRLQLHGYLERSPELRFSGHLRVELRRGQKTIGFCCASS